jgi:hypothetical protein
MSDEEFSRRMADEVARLTKAEDAAVNRKRQAEAAFSSAPDAASRHSTERQLEAADAELLEIGKRLTAARGGRIRYDSISPDDMLSPPGRNQLIMEAGRRGVADRI